jgi:alpha-beta hydrolase superfamily lysophospholipase
MAALGPPVLPVSDPGTFEEDTFESSKDKLQLYLKRWLPSGVNASPPTPPRAAIVFLHGFIEHYGRYDNVFKPFAQANIQVTAFDQRGFGRSWKKNANPKKAHGNTTWKQQFEDAEDMIRLERSRLDQKYEKDKVPLYLMGHSMVSIPRLNS